jgi:hypothetical protein
MVDEHGQSVPMADQTAEHFPADRRELFVLQFLVAGLPERFDLGPQRLVVGSKRFPLGILFPGGHAQGVEMKQFPDPCHPAIRPRLVLLRAARGVEEIAAGMSPAKGQQQRAGLDGRQGLVAAVAVDAQDAGGLRSKEGRGFFRAPRQGQRVKHRFGTAVDPQRAFAVGLFRELHKHLPAGLVGVPQPGGLAALPDRFVQRRQQGCQAAQSARQRAGRQVDAVGGQIGDQPLAGAKEQELVQQHLHPDGDAIASFGNQFWGRRGREDAGPAGAVTGGAVAFPANHAAMGADLDFQGFGVLGAGEGFVGQAALGAVLLVGGQVVEFFDGGQVVMGAMSGAWVVGLLAASAGAAAGGRGLLGAVLFFGLPAEQSMFELFHGGLKFLDFLLECGFPLLGGLELGSPIARLSALREQLPQHQSRVLKQLFGCETRDRNQGSRG